MQLNRRMPEVQFYICIHLCSCIELCICLLPSTQSQPLSLSRRPLTNICLIQSFRYSCIKCFLLHTCSMRCSYIHFGRLFPLIYLQLLQCYLIWGARQLLLCETVPEASHPTVPWHVVIGLIAISFSLLHLQVLCFSLEVIRSCSSTKRL